MVLRNSFELPGLFAILLNRVSRPTTGFPGGIGYLVLLAQGYRDGQIPLRQLV